MCYIKYTKVLFLSTPSGWRATSSRHRSAVRDNNFYPRPPGGGRHCDTVCVINSAVFLSTPSGWRATFACILKSSEGGISIHALRVEGDYSYFGPTGAGVGISIHALRVEGDKGLEKICKILSISIHALRVEGDLRWRSRRDGGHYISIHALRVEGDHNVVSWDITTIDFYPRPPGGGRHPVTVNQRHGIIISIHALRVEGDPCRYSSLVFTL